MNWSTFGTTATPGICQNAGSNNIGLVNWSPFGNSRVRSKCRVKQHSFDELVGPGIGQMLGSNNIGLVNCSTFSNSRVGQNAGWGGSATKVRHCKFEVRGLHKGKQRRVQSRFGDSKVGLMRFSARHSTMMSVIGSKSSKEIDAMQALSNQPVNKSH
eukprot:TRINITY_DN533_c0_g1_i5.p1 TRINITY_DN533_c0_g1~~TRINITY_DN533_c0_g1_i5.p1  ORF type:complete len:157 (+),score=3.19 TRINITY_DN533_c0_g1_i5:82-552(+)